MGVIKQVALWCLLCFPVMAFANSTATHLDPAGIVIFWVTLLFFFGMMGRYIAKRIGQAGVLGELIMGIVMGNLLFYFGVPLIVILREGSAIFTILGDMFAGAPLADAVHRTIPDPYYAAHVLSALSSPSNVDLIKVANVLDTFSRYGVIFLLFMVGLESSIEELKYTGRESIQVAVIGVLAPILFGLLAMYILSPSASFHSKLFVAATLSATSVGITARVLRDMKKIRTREARTILGAAMMDDILGLVILAVVSSIVLNGSVHAWDVIELVLHAALFFMGTVLLGPWVLKKAIQFFRFLAHWESKLIIAFLFMMTLAWFATQIQLGTIIGAFAAGIIIHDGLFDAKHPKSVDVSTIKMLVIPLESILAPLFFVLIGMQVKLESFADWHVLMVASGLIVAAMMGKLFSGLGGNPRDNRWLIGIGMLPRGEVGLVFASIGRSLGVMTDQLFSSIILMVIVTTLVTPPLLKAQYARTKARHHE